jgi:hypothetical protein
MQSFLVGMSNLDLHPDYVLLREQGLTCDIEFVMKEEKIWAHRFKIEPSSSYLKNLIR